VRERERGFSSFESWGSWGWGAGVLGCWSAGGEGVGWIVLGFLGWGCGGGDWLMRVMILWEVFHTKELYHPVNIYAKYRY